MLDALCHWLHFLKSEFTYLSSPVDAFDVARTRPGCLRHGAHSRGRPHPQGGRPQIERPSDERWIQINIIPGPSKGCPMEAYR